jgi:hypothetical protein
VDTQDCFPGAGAFLFGTSLSSICFPTSQPEGAGPHGLVRPGIAPMLRRRAGLLLTQKESKMPDDKSNVGEPDRSRVAGDQDYEVGYLADSTA